jgi:hypothetical protein
MATATPARLTTPRDIELLTALVMSPLTVVQLVKLSRTFAAGPFTSARTLLDRLQRLRLPGAKRITDPGSSTARSGQWRVGGSTATAIFPDPLKDAVRMAKFYPLSRGRQKSKRGSERPGTLRASSLPQPTLRPVLQATRVALTTLFIIGSFGFKNKSNWVEWVDTIGKTVATHKFGGRLIIAQA